LLSRLLVRRAALLSLILVAAIALLLLSTHGNQTSLEYHSYIST
jgi:hypothetical protein